MKQLTLLLLVFIAVPALGQTPFEAAPEKKIALEPSQHDKIGDFRRLVQGPDIRRLIEADRSSEPAASVDADPRGEFSGIVKALAAAEERARGRFRAILSAVPRIPAEMQHAFLRLRAEAIGEDFAVSSTTLIVLGVFGIVAEWVVRHRWRHHLGGLLEILPLLVFASLGTIFFFAVEWPPMIRIVSACFLVSIVGYRFAAAGIALAAHSKMHLRLKIVAGLGVTTIVLAAAAEVAGIDENVILATAYICSGVVLALAIALVWSELKLGSGIKMAVTLYLAGLWLLWCVDLRELFWLGFYLIALPPALRTVANAVRQRAFGYLLIPPYDNRSIFLVHGSRAAVIGLAIAWIAFVWETDSHSLGHGEPVANALFYGTLKSIVALILADLIWHLAKAGIDRGAAPTSATAAAGAGFMEAQATRLHTLLPILRKVLAVALLLVCGLIVLSELGIDIGPLIAGAGIFGVALGFGSQTLMRDVISGFFYLFDDAFRVGEYIQAKSYKGTVEGFSLRSVKLRHSRGPIFTVPFGELGAVENMSRDWSKVKFLVTVPYDTDMNTVRKIGKTIGQDLTADPELGPLFIQPLKMKGVEEFGEYGIVISFALITVPTGQQSFIRRTVNAKLRTAFQENSVAFAQPTINVSGGEKGEVGAAAAGHRQAAKAICKPLAAEGE